MTTPTAFAQPVASTSPRISSSLAFPHLAPTFGRVNPAPVPISPRPAVADLDKALHMLGDAERTILAQEARIRQLESLAVTDELTGLLNRRGFMSALRRELAQTRRQKNGRSLLVLIDLDGFKQINDEHGHAVGDAYLQAVAGTLLNEVRTTDHVARMGGDEFAVLMTQINAKDAAKRLTALETTFHKRMMHQHTLCLPLRGSFGFAVLVETETPESLLVAADMKLYADKAKKRMARK